RGFRHITRAGAAAALHPLAGTIGIVPRHEPCAGAGAQADPVAECGAAPVIAGDVDPILVIDRDVVHPRTDAVADDALHPDAFAIRPARRDAAAVGIPGCECSATEVGSGTHRAHAIQIALAITCYAEKMIVVGSTTG